MGISNVILTVHRQRKENIALGPYSKASGKIDKQRQISSHGWTLTLRGVVNGLVIVPSLAGTDIGGAERGTWWTHSRLEKQIQAMENNHCGTAWETYDGNNSGPCWPVSFRADSMKRR